MKNPNDNKESALHLLAVDGLNNDNQKIGLLAGCSIFAGLIIVGLLFSFIPSLRDLFLLVIGRKKRRYKVVQVLPTSI
jgi:hypothetical protein